MQFIPKCIRKQTFLFCEKHKLKHTIIKNDILEHKSTKIEYINR